MNYDLKGILLEKMLVNENGEPNIKANSLKIALNCAYDCLRLGLDACVDYLIQAKGFAQKDKNNEMINGIDEILKLKGIEQYKEMHHFIKKYYKE